MQKNDDKYRVTTMITAKEKEWLQHLAWKSGRSMSGYIRHFVNEDIERNSD
jgi:predicted DNA-binding protein